MPELPEVETIRRDLEKDTVGKRIKAVEVSGARTVRRHRNRNEFIKLVEGHKITGVVRIGVIGTTARWLVPPLLEAMAADYPRVRVVVVCALATAAHKTMAVSAPVMVPFISDRLLEKNDVNVPRQL